MAAPLTALPDEPTTQPGNTLALSALPDIPPSPRPGILQQVGGFLGQQGRDIAGGAAMLGQDVNAALNMIPGRRQLAEQYGPSGPRGLFQVPVQGQQAVQNIAETMGPNPLELGAVPAALRVGRVVRTAEGDVARAAAARTATAEAPRAAAPALTALADEQGGVNLAPIQNYLAQRAQTRTLAGSLGDRVIQLQGERKADQVVLSRALDQVTAGASRQDMEVVYHALEKPRPLTPVQQQIYNALKPIRDATQVADAQIASNLDRPVRQITDIGYVRRQPLDVGSQIDRIRAQVGGLGRGILQKTAGGEPHRVFTKLVNPETGSEMVARVDKGRVVAYGQPGGQAAGKPAYFMGTMDRAAGADVEATGEAPTMFRARNGVMYRMQSPTTEEVEAWTGQRYYKNAAYSVLQDYHDTMAVKRATDFLATLPNDPEFATVAVPKGGMEGVAARAKGWRTPDIPQLGAYLMDPKVAGKLESLVGRSRIQPPNKLVQGMYALQRGIVQAGLSLNFIAHPTNMALWGAANRGLLRWVNPASYGRWFRSLTQASYDTVHMTPRYLDMLREGAPLQYTNNVQLGKRLVDMAQQDLTRHPDLLAGMAQRLGTTPVRILQAVRQRSHDLAFMSSDIAYLQGAYERMLEGKGARQAVAETSRHFPTYRVPDWWPQLFPAGNEYTLFVPYHASALEAFGNMVKDLIPAVTPGVTAAQRLEAAEKLALVGIGVVAIAPAHGVVQRAIQDITGNPNARLRAFGPLSIPTAAARVAMGQERPLYGAETALTPSPLTNLGVSAVQARSLSDLLKNAQKSIVPFQLSQYAQNPGWGNDWQRTLLSLPASMFISTPPPKSRPYHPGRIGPALSRIP